jgi:hypothetical protein
MNPRRLQRETILSIKSFGFASAIKRTAFAEHLVDVKIERFSSFENGISVFPLPGAELVGGDSFGERIISDTFSVPFVGGFVVDEGGAQFRAGGFEGG